jgi:hypothetical protein
MRKVFLIILLVYLYCVASVAQSTSNVVFAIRYGCKWRISNQNDGHCVCYRDAGL